MTMKKTMPNDILNTMATAWDSLDRILRASSGFETADCSFFVSPLWYDVTERTVMTSVLVFRDAGAAGSGCRLLTV